LLPSKKCWSIQTGKGSLRSGFAFLVGKNNIDSFHLFLQVSNGLQSAL
jgi:hypothetical protein